MPCRTTQDGWVIMKSSDKTRSTGEGNGNPLQYSCLENPVHRMKREIVVSTEKSEREMVCLSEGKRGKPNADGEESLEKDTGLKGRRNWGNKMLEGDDLRETLSGITPRKKENKTQSLSKSRKFCMCLNFLPLQTLQVASGKKKKYPNPN